MSECDERNDVSRLKLKKLCDQYRGKFPRIDGMRDLKDKSIAVLHFSAGKIYTIIVKVSSNKLLIIKKYLKTEFFKSRRSDNFHTSMF